MLFKLIILCYLGSVFSAGAQQIPSAERRSDFHTFVHDFTDSYVYQDRTDKPWLTWEPRFGPSVERAETKQAFAGVLAEALSELHDFHAEVRSRVLNRWLPVPTFADLWAELRNEEVVITAVRTGSDAERAGVLVGDRVRRINSSAVEQAMAARLTPAVQGTDPAEQQWALLSVLAGRADEARHLTLAGKDGAERTVVLPVERHFVRTNGLLTSRILAGNLGLIRINNSLGDQKTVTAFDTALKDLRGTRGLILDLRDVPSGGDSSVALGIMGRFVSTMLPYQRHRIPNYGQADVERNWIEQVAPRGPFRYAQPVVVLVDHWTGSMGEGMAVGFDGMGRALVMGTSMAHLAGAVSAEMLPKTGVEVAWATEQLFHVNGTARQVWVPTVVVGEQAEDQDGLLRRALLEMDRLRAKMTQSDAGTR